MIRKDEKTAVIEANRTHATDTGSPEVQIAILTARILLPEHIQLVLFQYPERVLYLVQSFAVFKLCLQFFSPVL